jgi:hypothetical protein
VMDGVDPSGDVSVSTMLPLPVGAVESSRLPHAAAMAMSASSDDLVMVVRIGWFMGSMTLKRLLVQRIDVYGKSRARKVESARFAA